MDDGKADDREARFDGGKCAQYRHRRPICPVVRALLLLRTRTSSGLARNISRMSDRIKHFSIESSFVVFVSHDVYRKRIRC